MTRTHSNRICALLLALALLAGLCGCGRAEVSKYKILSVLGTKRYSVIYRKDDRLAETVDTAMETLAANGTLSAISTRWLNRNAITLEGSLPTPALPGADAETEEDADAAPARTLIVGVEQNFAPMAYYEQDGGLRGMSIEIADALGALLNWEVRYQPISPADIETQLASGNVDCALGFDPGEVSASKCTVGVTYMESDVVVAALTNSDYGRIKDLRGMSIGTIDDPVVIRYIRADEDLARYAGGATVYVSLQRCMTSLENDWCAAVAMDRIMLEYLK